MRGLGRQVGRYVDRWVGGWVCHWVVAWLYWTVPHHIPLYCTAFCLYCTAPHPAVLHMSISHSHLPFFGSHSCAQHHPQLCLRVQLV